MKPAVLKNIPDFKVSANLMEVKLIKAKIGNVPKAKTNIVKAPLKKLPVVNEYIWIDCVNPQGKKNVERPKSIGTNLLVYESLSIVESALILGILS